MPPSRPPPSSKQKGKTLLPAVMFRRTPTMAEEAQLAVLEKGSRKRKLGKKKGSKGKKMKMPVGSGEKKAKVNPKLKKLFRKRARDYNSDEDEADDSIPALAPETEVKMKVEGEDSSDGEDVQGSEGEEDDEIQPGIMRFNEGCRAFKVAYKNIIKKHVADDSLGPVLSAHKLLIAKKLTQEAAERKVKGEAKKEKQLVAEKGHVKPANYLDSHEKFLIGVATKGVVKLFNSVNKAQNAQKGFNPSRTRDAKVIWKRRKEAFFSELSKTSSVAPSSSSKEIATSAPVNDEGPAWAPLRDNYMLTNPKLKDWDKQPDATRIDDMGRMSEDSGSDDD